MTKPDRDKPSNDLRPIQLTAEDLKRAAEEADEWRAAVREATAKLERITASDMQIRLR